MDNSVYGRSPLEAASFIVSSAFPDKKLHGRSFLARLSGSTAEMMSMWLLMMEGPSPFKVNEETGEVNLSLRPILPDFMFDDNNEVTFSFLGSIPVTYMNPDRKDTWSMTPKSYAVTKKGSTTEGDEDIVQVEGADIDDEELTLLIRNGEVSKIVVSY
jgi:hypothetical protein